MINGLFSPGSIAVAGASRDRRAVGRRILDALVEGPFEGPVYAINPAATHVGSVPAHPSLSAIGKPVDLVVVAVPAKLVHEVVAEAADVGAGHVVVVSAGVHAITGSARSRTTMPQPLPPVMCPA